MELEEIAHSTPSLGITAATPGCVQFAESLTSRPVFVSVRWRTVPSVSSAQGKGLIPSPGPAPIERRFLLIAIRAADCGCVRCSTKLDPVSFDMDCVSRNRYPPRPYAEKAADINFHSLDLAVRSHLHVLNAGDGIAIVVVKLFAHHVAALHAGEGILRRRLVRSGFCLFLTGRLLCWLSGCLRGFLHRLFGSGLLHRAALPAFILYSIFNIGVRGLGSLRHDPGLMLRLGDYCLPLFRPTCRRVLVRSTGAATRPGGTLLRRGLDRRLLACEFRPKILHLQPDGLQRPGYGLRIVCRQCRLSFIDCDQGAVQQILWNLVRASNLKHARSDLLQCLRGLRTGREAVLVHFRAHARHTGICLLSVIQSVQWRRPALHRSAEQIERQGRRPRWQASIS